MAKYIAHSSIDERGRISGGQAGDQTKKEVCIRTWYNFAATQVIRITHEEIRIQFANNMIDCANNDNIGYDQGGRNTLLTEAEKVGFDFSKIKVKCECDCSSLATICILGAIYKILGKDAYLKAKEVLVVKGNCATTSTLKTRLQNVGVIQVKVYNQTAYTRGTSNAVYGDIYNKPGSHVVCFIDNGKKRVLVDDELKFKYRAKTKEDGWLPEVNDLEDYAGIIGHEITDIAIGVNIGTLWYQAHTIDGEWLPPVTGYDINDFENGYAGNGTPIDAIRVYYDTPIEYAQKYGYEKAQYRVSPVKEGYYPWQYDDETIKGQDGYAGMFGKTIDRFQLF